ncbi:IgGFc-binding protein [Bacterioplanoides sp. SCSIO 12839]|uniref:IgGFc-binding protein n=1 Tax=Bacterioplanoides sp. SCSIO 12839 TaxID=2829569 RepID=UPI00210707EC|nr:IgGFc-binding protein [Bacterioplanoides sp. SCSIO 12839]UTW47588.1 IgGFc-binding protein [Bacterioplanoides sp. SCSIO 12839]
MSLLIRIILNVFAVVLIFSSGAHAAVDSRGKEFMFSFPQNYTGGNLKVFIASEYNVQGTVSIASLNFFEEFNLVPNEVKEIALPASAQISSSNTIENKSVHIVSDQEITVYGLNEQRYTTDAFLALPTDALGLEYHNASYKSLGSYRSSMTVTAVYDNTTVTFSPKVSTAVVPADGTHTITLNSGETYKLDTNASSGDMTGSLVTASAPVAVMGSVQCTNIPSGYSACDHIVEMLPPVATYGKSFITIPLASRKKGDMIRVIASEDNTQIIIDGELKDTLKKGAFYEEIIQTRSIIDASAPVMVVQYSLGQSYDGVISDPFMMVVPPSEQFLNDYNFVTLTESVGFQNSFVNVVTTESALSSLILDGQLIDSTQFSRIGQSEYFGAQLTLQSGVHNMMSDETFGIYVYGFGSYDSYGYPGGMSFDFINPRGDAYIPNSRLELMGDFIIGYASDSEDLNANNVFDVGEDLNGDGQIGKRTEDLNNNGLLDDGEDLNNNGVLDRDTGIFRIELDADAENISLDVDSFVPGALNVNFVVSKVDPSLPALGHVIISDGAGNKNRVPVNFINTPTLTGVTVTSTFSNNQIELIDGSFSETPTRIEDKGDKTEVEWHYDQFLSDQVKTLTYDLLMRNPVAAETRLVLHELKMAYTDVNGNPVVIQLGTKAVKVAPSVLFLNSSIDKVRYRPTDAVLISNAIQNKSEFNDQTDLVVSIEDANGNLVESIETRSVTIEKNNTLLVNDMTFNVAGIATGEYRVKSQLVANNGTVLRESKVPFTVVTENDQLVDLAASVYSSQPVYSPWDNVSIETRLQNMASNSSVPLVTAELKVKAPNGQIILQQSRDISSIAPSAVYQYSFALPLQNALEGDYQLIWTAKNATGMLVTATNSFQVQENLFQQLAGNVQTSADRIFHDDSVECQFSVQNRGRNDIDDVLFATSVVNIENEQLISREEVQKSIPEGETTTWNSIVQAPGKVYGAYACVLEAKVNDVWKVLDSKAFEIQSPKITAAFESADMGRILVLTDESRQCSALEDIKVELDTEVELNVNKKIEVLLYDLDGNLVDHEILSQLDVYINKNSSNSDADLIVKANSAGKFEVTLESTVGLDQQYKVVIKIKKGWFSKIEKSWNVDCTCDRPLTLHELYEDAKLLAWHPWHSDDDLRDVDPFGPITGPTVTEQNEFLESYLQQNNWQYTLVHTAEDFAKEHRLGGYATYMILSERPHLHWHVQKEIREAVFAGKGLIVAGSYDKRNLWLEHALGLSVLGRHPWAVSLNVNESELSNAWQAPLVFDKAQGVLLKGAATLAEFTLAGDEHTEHWKWLDNSHAIRSLNELKSKAITAHNYGLGKSLFFSFDLLYQAASYDTDIEFEDLIKKSLFYVQSSDVSKIYRAALPLNINWANVRGAVDVVSELQIPHDVSLLESDIFSHSNDVWMTEFNLQRFQEVNSRIYLQLNNTYDTSNITLLTKSVDGDHETVQTPVTFSLITTDLPTMAETQSNLDSLAWSYWYRINYRSAWLKFKLAKKAVAREHWYEAQTLLLLAADLLIIGNESDVQEIRQELQKHIQYVSEKLAK